MLGLNSLASAPLASFGGQTYVVSVVENSALSDSVAAQNIIQFVASETSISSDNNSVARVFSATITETRLLSDALTTSYIFVSTAIEAAASSDNLVSSAIFASFCNESVACSDVLLVGIFADRTETVSSIDAYSATAIWQQAFAEATSLSDASGGLRVLAISANEVGNTLDNFFDSFFSVTEAVIASESITVSRVISGAVFEQSASNDNYAQTGVSNIAAIESAPANDNQNTTAVLYSSANEVAFILDSYGSASDANLIEISTALDSQSYTWRSYWMPVNPASQTWTPVSSASDIWTKVA